MLVVQGSTFPIVLDELREAFRSRSASVDQERWQGMNVRGNPAARSHELRNVVLEVDLKGNEDLEHWRQQIRPNLPWADDHFLERVCGEPLNPAKEWANWPWAGSADRFRDPTKRFNHNYMERYWPKHARKTADGQLPPDPGPPYEWAGQPYGDLDDLVAYLAKEPTTRQAWLPIFFPVDTGYGDGGRKPCSLGYHFLCRDGQLHVWYPLRSCDFIRHFPDDCYLTVRLLLWVLDRCREIDPATWSAVTPGTYAMHCTSLHVFTNDMIQLRNTA